MQDTNAMVFASLRMVAAYGAIADLTRTAGQLKRSALPGAIGIQVLGTQSADRSAGRHVRNVVCDVVESAQHTIKETEMSTKIAFSL